MVRLTLYIFIVFSEIQQSYYDYQNCHRADVQVYRSPVCGRVKTDYT